MLSPPNLTRWSHLVHVCFDELGTSDVNIKNITVRCLESQSVCSMLASSFLPYSLCYIIQWWRRLDHNFSLRFSFFLLLVTFVLSMGAFAIFAHQIYKNVATSLLLFIIKFTIHILVRFVYLNCCDCEWERVMVWAEDEWEGTKQFDVEDNDTGCIYGKLSNSRQNCSLLHLSSHSMQPFATAATSDPFHSSCARIFLNRSSHLNKQRQ